MPSQSEPVLTTSGPLLKLRVFALTLLRFIAGGIMLTHGWLKLTDVRGTTDMFAQMGIPAPDVSVYLAILGELVGGAALLVGFLTPIASAGVLCVMAVAILFVHLPNGLLVTNNGFEYPLTMGAVALYFLARGAGPVSVDAWLAQRKAPEEPRHVPGQHPLQTGA